MDGIGKKKNTKGSIINLEPEMVLFSYLNPDLVEAAAATCTLVPQLNANSPLPSEGWGSFTCAGTELVLQGHPQQWGGGCSGVNTDMQPRGAAIALPEQPQPRVTCASASPAATHMGWPSPINPPVLKEGLKPCCDLPCCSQEKHHLLSPPGSF